MIKLTIDDRHVEVEEGTTVLRAAERLGVRIPRFCYHRCLSAVGSCRLCFVEIEGVENPVISCKEPAREGMVVYTNSEKARQARADTLEFILKNHPLDCPICDKSGECDLQNYFFEHSLRPSRLSDPKVKKIKAKRIGPHVMLDAERCVLCTRCVRFCEEIAGVHEIGVFERGDRSTIGVIPGGEPARLASRAGLEEQGDARVAGGLSNPYSLMTVDLCPVGALTSVDFRFRKRAWLLERSPSVCLGCARVCSVWIDHEGGRPYRIRPRENQKVNGCIMCDHGRMTYKALLPENRILSPRITRGGESSDVGWPEALGFVAGLVASGAASEIVGVVSAQSSVEDNEAMAGMCISSLKAAKILRSGLCFDSSFADEILRSADRNPNSIGAMRFAPEGIKSLRKGAGYIILDGLSEDDLMKIVDSRPAWVVLIASSIQRGLGWADAVLPKAMHTECGGTFINIDGVEQRAAAVFSAPGQAKNLKDIAAMLAEAAR